MKTGCSLVMGDHHGRVSPAPRVPSEIAPGPDVVTQLLREQAPHLAHLPVRRSRTSGSSNWVFRLADDMAVRMPRTDDYTQDLLNEIRWLPQLAPKLPVPVPTLVAVGQASELFPRPWTVVSWVPGHLPVALDDGQQGRFARTFGDFLQTLHGIDTDGAQPGAEHWGYRCGEPVTDTIDAWAEQAATALADLFNPAAIREAWRRLREVPPPTGHACLIHTDLSPENLLTHLDGRLTGVIDFGGLGVGDRSVDFLYAWSMLEAPCSSGAQGCSCGGRGDVGSSPSLGLRRARPSHHRQLPPLHVLQECTPDHHGRDRRGRSRRRAPMSRENTLNLRLWRPCRRRRDLHHVK